jgi:hypothetical protein
VAAAVQFLDEGRNAASAHVESQVSPNVVDHCIRPVAYGLCFVVGFFFKKKNYSKTKQNKK